MKKLMIALFLFVVFNAEGQVQTVSLQASGLTCSMCSNAINKSLRTIDYIENVKANIQNSSFEISFKPGAKVNFDDLKKKVEDAGFSVANLTVIVNFEKTSIANDEHINIEGIVLHFLNVKDQELSGIKTLRILDKGYVSSKEYKKNGKYTKLDCYTTGTVGKCCSKNGLTSGTRIYHVTI